MTACDHCGKEVHQSTGAINRAIKLGVPIYCDRVCFGLGRRKNKTPEQKRAEKATYDRRLRVEHAVELAAKRKQSFKKNYDPKKAAIQRKARMHLHVEYCRRPEYCAYKHQYDLRYKMEKNYGGFWEVARALVDLTNELKSRATKYEIYEQNGTLNKSMKRKRQYGQTVNDQSRPHK